MNKKPILISCAGNGTVGKDTLATLIQDKLSLRGLYHKRFALAYALKQDIQQQLLDKYNINVFDCTPEEKERIRPDLVEYGKQKREISQGRYWTQIVEDQIKSETNLDVAICSDIRYSVYPKDETWWVKEHMGGTLIHISRYFYLDNIKTFIKPANFDEETNDPVVKRQADFWIEWETLPYHELEIKYGYSLDLLIDHILTSAKLNR